MEVATTGAPVCGLFTTLVVEGVVPNTKIAAWRPRLASVVEVVAVIAVAAVTGFDSEQDHIAENVRSFDWVPWTTRLKVFPSSSTTESQVPATVPASLAVTIATTKVPAG